MNIPLSLFFQCPVLYLLQKILPHCLREQCGSIFFIIKTERHNHDGNDDKPIDIRTALNEIDSKEHLINVSEKYRMPLEETVLTKQQLEYYKNLLEELEGKK